MSVNCRVKIFIIIVSYKVTLAFLFRHSGLYGFHIMKMNNKRKFNYENVLSNPSNVLNIVEIPLQSTTDTQLEVLNDNLLNFLPT